MPGGPDGLFPSSSAPAAKPGRGGRGVARFLDFNEGKNKLKIGGTSQIITVHFLK